MFIHYFKRSYLFIILLFVASASFADAYKWVDNQGVTNYSQDEPTTHKAVLIQGPPPPASDPLQTQKEIATLIEIQNGTFEENEQERERLAMAEADQKDKDEYCEVNRNNLQEYQNNPGRRMIDADGNVTQPTEEQRQQKIMDIEERLAEHCQ